MDKRQAVIRTEKAISRRPFRQIFWTEDTNTLLKEWITARNNLGVKNNDPEALFISIPTYKISQRLGVRGIGDMLRSYSNKAKLPYQNAHSFRHHMGHNIIKQGGSNSDVSNILGHSNLESSYIYTMMDNQELKERHAKFVKN